MARGEHESLEGVAFPDGADANFPLSLTERLPSGGGLALAGWGAGRGGTGHFVGRIGRRWRRAGRRLLTWTGFGAAHFPRIAELIDALGHLTRAHPQVVLAPAVKVAAQSAQAVLEGRRHRHFQEALTVPQKFDSCSEKKSLSRPFNWSICLLVTYRYWYERQRCNLPGRWTRRPDWRKAATLVCGWLWLSCFGPESLSSPQSAQRETSQPSLLQWISCERTYRQGDRFGPRKRLARSGIVGHTHGETVVLAVGCEQVLARALKVEHAAVVRPIVRVTEHGAYCVIWRDNFKLILI